MRQESDSRASNTALKVRFSTIGPASSGFGAEFGQSVVPSRPVPLVFRIRSRPSDRNGFVSPHRIGVPCRTYGLGSPPAPPNSPDDYDDRGSLIAAMRLAIFDPMH